MKWVFPSTFAKKRTTGAAQDHVSGPNAKKQSKNTFAVNFGHYFFQPTCFNKVEAVAVLQPFAVSDFRNRIREMKRSSRSCPFLHSSFCTDLEQDHQTDLSIIF